ncbi:hypothetical protein ACFFJY_19660 [Fictibacillus aquaticus]|uniref:Uncharacterized protein n=1 Tax=Fictibacillus aquaticus TaxID=2021314 RepID=A0A235F6S8_9BACL|nr:hypothetical protein [Fictibacillus aquaticus]OYD56385.1 hypothetical protein CGZ90_17685 [Fictibacillus aquaticus]
MILAKERLLSALKDFIEKHHDDALNGTPPLIRKKELEGFIETSALNMQIAYSKHSSTTQTFYLFDLLAFDLTMEINYRYKSFYTRHTSSVAYKT